MLTGRWFRGDRTLAQGPVTSFDQGDFVWRDRTLRGERPNAKGQCLVDSSKVPERENRDWTRPVSADWTLSSVWSHCKHWRSGCTDRSIRST